MRHDPASAAVEVMLRGLKMYGLAQAVGELIEQGAPAFKAAVPILSQLLKAEMSEREVRSIAYQIKAARFPAYKDMAGFDFASSEVNEALVRQLHSGEFIDGAHNVVAVGGPGKTHIATALGVQAVEHHRKKVRFFSTVDLVNMLEQEKAANKAGQLAERLLRLDLVILDAMPEKLLAKLPRYDRIPAALIGRLARDEGYRGQGVGGLLLRNANERILLAADGLAVHSIVVDAKDAKSFEFCREFGFGALPLDPLRLFMTVAKAAASFGPLDLQSP